MTGAAEDFAERVAAKVRKFKSKSRALTHPPLPVVETFEELLRFARIAVLNGEEPETIREFFATTREEVTVMDLDRVQQRVFVATNHTTKTHIISFRGTRNLTNVVQNIRLSSNPVTASGRLAMVGRSLSGSFSFLRGAGAKDSNDSSGSGSFDEDEECANIDFEADPSEFARRGCTDHLPMHRGYRVVAKECVDTIAPHIVPGYTIQLTGHSLGGAVAVAVGLLYKTAGIEVGKVVTFGAPSSGRGRRGRRRRSSTSCAWSRRTTSSPCSPCHDRSCASRTSTSARGSCSTTTSRVSTRPSPESGATRASSGGSERTFDTPRAARRIPPDGTRRRRRLPAGRRRHDGRGGYIAGTAREVVAGAKATRQPANGAPRGYRPPP